MRGSLLVLLTFDGRSLSQAQQGEDGDEDDIEGLHLGVGGGGGARGLLGLSLLACAVGLVLLCGVWGG